MKIFLKLFFLLIIFISYLYPQQKTLIYFVDKGPVNKTNIKTQTEWVEKNSSKKALKRRILRAESSLISEKDFPLYLPYVEEVEKTGIKIVHKLRWFNALSVYADQNQIELLNKLSYVKKIEPVKTFKYKNPVQPSKEEIKGAVFSNGENLLQETIDFVGATSLKEDGLTGNDVIIGVFDTGFELGIPAMQNINSRLIAAYDFVSGDNIVYDEAGESGMSGHGTKISSIIGGLYSDDQITYEGIAPGASFILCKTEDTRSETSLEEDNWAAAAEFAELRGVDIVSSSLNYSEFDQGELQYTYNDMDGNTTIVTQAANMLAEHGVIVVSSAGNEGNNSWHYITAPADGEDVIAVGAVNYSGIMASFSSYGPTSDGRLKPEVVAPGVNVPVATRSGGFISVDGTSAACPVVAGGLALILEAYPNKTIKQIRGSLISSSSLQLVYGQPVSPNNQHGYGVPQFSEMRMNVVCESLFGQNDGLTIFPNPSSKNVIGVVFSTQLQKRAKLKIYNILGQIVLERQIEAGKKYISININAVYNRPSGVYFFTIEINNNRYTKKFIRI